MPYKAFSEHPGQLLKYFKLPILIITVGISISIFVFVIVLQMEMAQTRKNFVQDATYSAQLLENYIAEYEKNLAFSASMLSQGDFGTALAHLNYLYENGTTSGFLLFYDSDPSPLERRHFYSDAKLVETIIFADDDVGYAYDKNTDILFYSKRLQVDGRIMYLCTIIDIRKQIADIMENYDYSVYVYDNDQYIFGINQQAENTMVAALRQLPNTKELLQLTSPYHQIFTIHNHGLEVAFAIKTFTIYGSRWITSWLVLIFSLVITLFFSYEAFKYTTENRRIKQRVEELTHEIKKSEEKYRAIIDTTVDGVITIDRQGIIQSYNQGCEKMFGISTEAAVGKNVKLLMTAKDSGRHDHYLDNYLKSGVKKIIGTIREVEGRRITGEAFPITLSVSKIQVDDQIYFSGILRDISARKKAEADLYRAYQELSSFGHVLAHDLKAPIRTITGFVELLRKAIADGQRDKVDKYFDFINDASLSMQDLIDTLSEYTKIDNKGVEFAEINMMTVVESVLGNLHQDIELSEAKVTFSDLPTVIGNQPQLIQLLQNIVGNALKYCRDRKPVITISVEKRQERWQFSIQDNGIGFNNKYSKEVFEPFKRLQGASEYKGTGLGLATCKKIIDRHQGKIWCSSEEGLGTCFFFTLKSADNDTNANR